MRLWIYSKQDIFYQVSVNLGQGISVLNIIEAVVMKITNMLKN